MTDPLRNPKDPLRGSGPDAGIELFRALGKTCSDYPNELVVNAATNIFVNALRQSCPTWQQAEKAFDEIFGRSKQLLKDHYDAAGRKKGIFPFDQVIFPPTIKIDKLQ